MKLTKLRELKQILLKKFQILIIINQTVQLTHTLGLRDNLVTGVTGVTGETDVTSETETKINIHLVVTVQLTHTCAWGDPRN